MRRRPAAGGASTASASAAEVHMILVKAEEAAQESRQTKQDRCAEMRRKKDEEREAEEQSQMYSFGRSCCRIQVENLGRLSGVMDDRGKYIYISMDETNAVADYIKREGRVKFFSFLFIFDNPNSVSPEKIPKILGSGPSLWLLGPFDQLSFMSDLDVQIPSAFDPFADANAEDSGAVTKDYVHIRIQQRNGRKSLTTVQGLKKEFSYNKILKDLKKEFCCNGTVVQDPELGQVIQLQGDQRKNVSTFLVQAGIVKKDNIKIHGF
ncbi:hypothetical protein V6N11_038696 [Hibiscus sabdariffa]